MAPVDAPVNRLLAEALESARETRAVHVSAEARHYTAAVFEDQFGSARALIVADPNTFRVAGRDIYDSFRRNGRKPLEPFLFDERVYAEYSYVDQLYELLRSTDALPVAVGSGTINDLTKLAAHRAGRPYLAAATAASMDGYTAHGASITRNGDKQTFQCPAPRAVVADLEVISAAPPAMTASGYADLLAKCAAGGDWLLADAAGEEPLQPGVWGTVQTHLREWLAEPDAVAAGDPQAVLKLLAGLLMTGFAMQAMRSSRPASGAEHQFSHLWDMQHHTHCGAAPSHGFKVGIGTLASLAMHDHLLECGMEDLDLDGAVPAWPDLETLEKRLRSTLSEDAIVSKALEETRAKHPSRERLRKQLLGLRESWPALSRRLWQHLPRFSEARELLRAAGCPVEPEDIGISRDRLRCSYEQAWYIRRRYTILDFMQRASLWDASLDTIFGQHGPWPLCNPNTTGDESCPAS